MPHQNVILPSGATGVVRGLKGRELNTFANHQAARSSKTSQQILSSVWIETGETGPLYDSGKIDWKEAPECDRFTALFFARIATFGEEYEFPCQCENCGKRYDWVEDLSLREVKPLPKSSIEAFLNGNRFETKAQDADGEWKRVVFQLKTPKIEERIARVTKLSAKEKATASLAQRIVSIEGLPDGKGPIKEFLEDMDYGPLLDMIEAMDEVDGGIDTFHERHCPHCGWEEEGELPFDRFWTPPKRRSSTDG